MTTALFIALDGSLDRGRTASSSQQSLARCC
jgi:hypothetical protein